MHRDRRLQQLTGIFLIAFVLLNFPILNVWAGDRFTGSFPTLFLGIFATWAALIGLLVLIVRKKIYQKRG